MSHDRFPVVAAAGVARLELFAFTLACEEIIQDVVDYLKHEAPDDGFKDAKPGMLGGFHGGGRW